MYNWLTRTRQGQIVSFLVLLFLIASYTNLFRSKEPEDTQGADEQKKAEPAYPAPSPAAPSKESATEPDAPKPMTLERLIDELTSFSKTQISKTQDQLAELGKPAVKELQEESGIRPSVESLRKKIPAPQRPMPTKYEVWRQRKTLSGGIGWTKVTVTKGTPRYPSRFELPVKTY